MIVGKNITKKFEELTVFENFDFEIQDGEFVCFSGESGSGKTTLLNIIGLLEPIDSGKLIINGREYKTNRDKREYYKNEIGFLFQNFALIENKTVRQNLRIVKKTGTNKLDIECVVGRVGLKDKLDNKIYTLSGGEQQRIALARLMLKDCNIILADEPTGSLDKRNATAVMGFLRQLNEEGKTVVVVTHDEHIKKMADRRIEI